MNRIRIIGSCGSGKTTLAREISELKNIPFYQLDNFVWDRSEESKRFPEAIRNDQLNKVVNNSKWIIEGVHYNWSHESFMHADVIFVLTPHVLVRDWRILKRFIKTRWGLEESNYKQTFQNVFKMMYAWNHKYEINKVMEITEKYNGKRVVINNHKEIWKYINDS
ncbi:hypothetical protein D7Z26_00190 [Cohnella endophytica]|uniref:DNA topology modulation protein FlaR n=1 Tax=Cohnella endophytica TaxID=2419778 RepID=A0A494Y5S4_9BACL|nr:AAA family ATPase [Cohnella endophytica]RKP57972.1 hypothetical protein D7Z26_00190 [Cohnella endophytica]